MTTALEPDLRTAQIGGESHKVRRLNVRDAFTTLRIMSTVTSHASEQLSRAITVDDNGKQTVDANAFGVILISAIPYCEETVYELMGSLINMDADTFANEMPPSAPLEIVEHVIQTQDFEDFLRTLRRLWKADETIQKVWNKLST